MCVTCRTFALLEGRSWSAGDVVSLPPRRITDALAARAVATAALAVEPCVAHALEGRGSVVARRTGVAVVSSPAAHAHVISMIAVVNVPATVVAC